MVEAPRHSKAVEVQIITDPIELARREAANALEQSDQVQALIAQHVVDKRPFKLRLSTILHLHRAVLAGISAYAAFLDQVMSTLGKASTNHLALIWCRRSWRNSATM